MWLSRVQEAERGSRLAERCCKVTRELSGGVGGCAQAHRTCPPKAFISTQPSGVLPEARGTACFRVYGPDFSRAAGSPSEKKGPLPASGDIGAGHTALGPLAAFGFGEPRAARRRVAPDAIPGL